MKLCWKTHQFYYRVFFYILVGVFLFFLFQRENGNLLFLFLLICYLLGIGYDAIGHWYPSYLWKQKCCKDFMLAYFRREYYRKQSPFSENHLRKDEVFCQLQEELTILFHLWQVYQGEDEILEKYVNREEDFCDLENFIKEMRKRIR